MTPSLISRIASQIPDSVDLGDERGVIAAITAIDPWIIHAPDELVQGIIEAARRQRLVEQGGTAASLLAIVAAFLFWLIALAPEHAFAGTAPVATSKGEMILVIAFVCIIATFVYGAIRNSGDMAEREATDADLEALNRKVDEL